MVLGSTTAGVDVTGVPLLVPPDDVLSDGCDGGVYDGVVGYVGCGVYDGGVYGGGVTTVPL